MLSQVVSQSLGYNSNANVNVNVNVNSNANSNANANYFRMQQQHLQMKQNDRHVLHLNNRACVLVLSNSEYSEAIKLYDTALMMHKEQTEEESTKNAHFEPYSSSNTISSSTTSQSSLGSSCHYQQQQEQQNNNNDNSIDSSYNEYFALDYSCDSVEHDDCEHDFSETEYDDDFGDTYMDWDGKDETVTTMDSHHSSINSQYVNENQIADSRTATSWSSVNDPTPSTSTSTLTSTVTHTQSTRGKIPRMTTFSRLRTLNYCGQQEYHEEHGLMRQHHYHHQVYSLPIVMEESEWDMAPVQDKTFVLIFNTALCNHLWGMQLMQQYIAATTATAISIGNTNAHEAVASLAEHCRETLTIAKLLYKLALENSVSFANGVDKICYVALYNNLSHVLKTLEGYDSAEAQWCDEMLLKAIFWWRDSNHHQQHGSGSSSSSSSNNSSSSQRSNASSTTTGTDTNNSNHHNNSPSDLYLDDDARIIDAFFENVFYRIGVSENIVPASAA